MVGGFCVAQDLDIRKVHVRGAEEQVYGLSWVMAGERSRVCCMHHESAFGSKAQKIVFVTERIKVSTENYFLVLLYPLLQFLVLLLTCCSAQGKVCEEQGNVVP